MPKHLICISFAAIVVLVASVSAFAYSGGAGTETDPYQISTPADMQAIGANPEDWGKHFILTANIDLAAYTGMQFNMIGTRLGNPFTGVFDGNDHTISNFTYTIMGTDFIGLFSRTDSTAVIKDLTLVDPNVNATGGSDYVGCLVGYLGSGTITGCGIKGGSVTGDSYTGGLVGRNYEGTISDCHTAGSVTGDFCTGGLVGDNFGTISNCYSAASVTGTGHHTGGLVGINEYHGTISNCYTAGSVSGTYGCTGGLVGRNYYGTISNCYAAGSVMGNYYTGGLVGGNWEGTITNCYVAGSVTGDSYTGGLLGYNDGGTVENSFWDINTTDQQSSAGGEGKTTAQMQTTTTFLVWACSGSWTIDDGNDYPRLLWQNLPGQPLPLLSDLLEGTGSEGQPYLIHTAEQLNLIGLFVCEFDKHFVLADDIDLSTFSGTEFNVIGTYYYYNSFTGTFDGAGHTISNFTYAGTGTGYIGLFGCAREDAVIKDLTLVTPNVNAAGALVGRLESGTITGCGIKGGSVTGHSNIGGLVGSNGGTISNCYATASVTGEGRVTGGLVGNNWGSGTISNCHATDSVTTGADWYTGGLVGHNSGMISNCYAEGSVSGDDRTGGLVGDNDGTIENCYAEGSARGDYFTGGLVGHNAGTISNCYGTGSVSGRGNETGGLVGRNFWGTIENCYAAGSVTGTVRTGGLVGYDWDAMISISASFWDVNTTCRSSSYGGEGKTTEQMQTQSTFTDAGWDFVGETINGPNDIWDICEAMNYPKLAWQIPLPGDFVCPDGVEINDLDVFVQQWLMEKLSADVAVGGGDGVVDFLDWAVLADGWQNTIDINDVADFAGQWLQFSAYCADIAPSPAGDGAVDMLDFAVLADNWLKGL